MHAWQIVWRRGIAPSLSTAALTALRDGLESDDRALIQGGTTNPPPLECLKDCPVTAACPLSYAGWKGDGLATVGEVEEYFARLCARADEALGEPAAIRHFLNHVDDVERATMRAELLAEVALALGARQQAAPAA